ncbi:MAG: GbsR/MarR family transcriptional regulator [Myxococcota bacterium]
MNTFERPPSTHESPDRMTVRVLQACDTVGSFIAWWGFKAIHGRVWTLLALRGAPMSQAEISRTLSVSRALVSGAVGELMGFGLVRSVGSGRTAPYEAVMDVWPVISDILREREWMMLESSRVSLEAAVEEAELMKDTGAEMVWSLERMRVLLGLTEMAQTFLKILIKLRLPRSNDALGAWLARATTFMATLRRLQR